jgi:hypothetical protein
MSSGNPDTFSPLEIENELQAVQRGIGIVQASVNDESIWLFLASLGCWGVPSQHFQIVAFVFVFVIFAERIRLAIKPLQLVAARLEAVDKLIGLLPTIDQVREGSALARVSGFKEKWSLFHRYAALFLSCMVFHCSSFVYILNKVVA